MPLIESPSHYSPELAANNSLSYSQMKVSRPSFKGSVEDYVMITNFKRFKRKGSTSKYKGVFFVKKEKKYRAQICLKGKKKYVGTFKNDFDAAIARDAQIREMFGEVEELLNFPGTNIEPQPQHQRTQHQIPQQQQQQQPQHIPILPMNTIHEEQRYQPQQHTDFHPVNRQLSNLTRYGSSACSAHSFGLYGTDQIPNNYNQFWNFPSRLGKRFSSSDSTLSFLNKGNLSHLNSQPLEMGNGNYTTNDALQALQRPTQPEPPSKRLKTT